MKIGKIYRKMNFLVKFIAKITSDIDFTKNYDIIMMGEDENEVCGVSQVAQKPNFYLLKYV